jgi:hypothetical protein
MTDTTHPETLVLEDGEILITIDPDAEDGAIGVLDDGTVQIDLAGVDAHGQPLLPVVVPAPLRGFVELCLYSFGEAFTATARVVDGKRVITSIVVDETIRYVGGDDENGEDVAQAAPATPERTFGFRDRPQR